MDTDGGRLQFSVGLDTRDLARDADEARRILSSVGGTAEREGESVDSSFKRIGSAVRGVFTMQAAIGFAREVVNVRKEIEGLEISFRTLLGSQQKADELFGSLRRFAAETPMDLKDLAKGAQTMLGFGMAGEEVMPILKAIGDISMGNRDQFNSLTLAFSQATAAGKLMGQDLMQMINAGFNPLTQLSEKSGKSIAELKDEMAAGAISAADLKEAFLGAAAAGGRYHGMLAAQSQGLGGSIAQLQGAYADMLNDIGTASQDAMAAAARGAGVLVKHYKEVGGVIAGLVAAYGTLRAVKMATEAYKGAGAAVRLQEEAKALDGLIGAEGRAKLSKAGLTQGTAAYAEGVKRLAAEEVRLAQVELARARTAVQASARVAAAKREEFIAAKGREASARAELALAVQSGNARAADSARRQLETATVARQTAAQELLNASRSKEAKQTAVAAAARRASAASTAVETAATNAAATANTALARAKRLAANAAGRLNKMVMANAYVLAAAAIAALGYGIYKLATYQTESEKAQRRLNDAMAQGEAAAAAEQAKVDALFGTLEGATKGTKAYEEAKGAILSQYGEYLKGLGDEKTALDDIAAAYEAVSQGVLKAARARAKESYLAKEQEEFSKKYSEGVQSLRETLAKSLGDREGNALLEKLKPAMEGRMEIEELGEDVKRALARFDKEVNMGAPDDPFAKTWIDNWVKAEVQALSAAHAQLKKAYADADAMFGEGQEELAKPTDIAGWQQRLKALQDENDALSDIDRAGQRGVALRKQIAEAELEIERLSRPPKQNKAYWDEKRKALVAELEALEDQGAVGEKGKEIKEKIRGIDRILKEAYDVGGGSGVGKAMATSAATRKEMLAQLAAREAEAARRAAFAVRQAEVDGMEEGFAKEMAAARLQYDRLEAENEKRREEMVENARQRKTLEGDSAGAAKVTEADLPKEQLEQLAEYARINAEALARAEKEALAKVMDEVLTYQQRRLQVEAEYAEKRKALYEDDGQTLRGGVEEGNVEELARAQEEALAAVDSQFAEREETYRAWMETLSRYSLDELKRALTEAEAALATLEKKGGGKGNGLAAARAKVAKLKAEVARAEAEAGNAQGPAQAEAAWGRLVKTLQTASGGFKELGRAVGGTVGEILDGVGEVAGMTSGLIGNIQSLVEASSSAMAASAGAASKAMSAVEKGSMILSIVSAVVQIGMKIASLFDRTKKIDEEIKAKQAEIDAIQWELNNRDAARLWREQGQEISGIIMGAMQAGAKLEMEKTMAFFSGKKAGVRSAAQEYERAYTEATERLAKKMANLSYEVGQAFGTDRYKNVRGELEAMSREMIARNKQMQDEASKGKKSDGAQIEKWQRENKETAQKMAELMRGVMEDIVGGSATDLASQLGDSLVDAFKAGEDAAEAWGRKVDDIVANMMKRMLIKQLLEKPMARLIGNLQAKAFKDGRFDEAGLMAGMAEFRDGMYGMKAQADLMVEAMKANTDIFKQDAAAGAGRSAAAKGIATASQDSVNELNGRMTAVQGHTYAIMEGTKVLQAVCGGILEGVRDVGRLSESIDRRLGRVEEDVARVRRAAELVHTDGVRVKG